MWKSLVFGGALLGTAFAQNPPSQIDFANLREDVRGLTQRIGELTLRLEQLERENSELRMRSSAADKSYATLVQLQEAIADLNRNIQGAVTTAKGDILQHVSAQLEKLAKQTSPAPDSLAKSQAPRTAPPGVFSDDYPKDGIKYEVQKGDTLAIIAKKTGARQQDIINANKLADPSHIVIGQTLFIPGGK